MDTDTQNDNSRPVLLVHLLRRLQRGVLLDRRDAPAAEMELERCGIQHRRDSLGHRLRLVAHVPGPLLRDQRPTARLPRVRRDLPRRADRVRHDPVLRRHARRALLRRRRREHVLDHDRRRPVRHVHERGP